MSVEDRFRNAEPEQYELPLEDMRPPQPYQWGTEQRLLVVIVLVIFAIGYFGT